MFSTTTRKLIFAGLLLLIALTAGGLVVYAQPPAPARPAPPPSAVPRWEYATILEVTGGLNNYAQLNSAAHSITTVKLYEIYQQLGGKHPEPDFRRVQLLNMLGRDGWELLDVTGMQIEQERVVRAFSFKRRLR